MNEVKRIGPYKYEASIDHKTTTYEVILSNFNLDELGKYVRDDLIEVYKKVISFLECEETIDNEIKDLIDWM